MTDNLNRYETEFEKNEAALNKIWMEETAAEKPAARKPGIKEEPADLTHLTLEEVKDEAAPEEEMEIKAEKPADLTNEVLEEAEDEAAPEEEMEIKNEDVLEETPKEPAAEAGKSQLQKELKMDLQRAMNEFETLSSQLDEAKGDLREKYAKHGRGVLGFGKNQAVKQAEKKFTKLSEDVEDKKNEIKKIQKNIDRA